jgi:hypothetical protein
VEEVGATPKLQLAAVFRLGSLPEKILGGAGVKVRVKAKDPVPASSLA